VTLINSAINNNTVIGGSGGTGGKAFGTTGRGNGNSGGQGGAGGTALGGALYLDDATTTVTGPSIAANVAQGGSGGNGGQGAAGRDGGNGGQGGTGGRGGAAQGGALFNTGGGTTTLTGTPLVANVARGGNSGWGGVGGALSVSTIRPIVVGKPGAMGTGGSGGGGQGGGAYVDALTTLYLNSSNVIGNVAAGGLLGIGHPNGANGAGNGGGVFTDVTDGGALITSPSTKIVGNVSNNTATE
jgi:hypothetical protein